MSVKELVDSAIEQSTIMIFSKSTCPYCRRAKALFKEKFPTVPTGIIEIDQEDNGSDIQAYLKEQTGQRTVPNIFINQQHVGGCDDVTALDRRDELAGLVNTTATIPST